MLQIKGVVLQSTLQSIRERLSTPEWEAFALALDPALRPLLENPTDPAAWIPAPALTALMQAYASVLQDDPIQTYRRLGRESCDDNLTAVYRLMSRLARPEFILRRAVRVWGDFYDRGEFEVLETSPESGAIRVTGAGFPHPALCHRIGGWIERAIELSGGREVRVDHPACVFEGADCEEWRASWKL